eukprot:Protomagalhaensia_wolfi_Nauph_80__6095@NODE_865_length_1931_cov_35_249471_g652_i0_p1_GENE_NODE_865_length_1931_cov_35_249471_g652_i0NODE_865_length_1931_cov_35_249471_g652_i0_p1_ORF_typecomplete_len575_score79_01Asp/PF00026_23/2_9e23Asp/PF00026_23/2_7e14TAXi_N/PF14543_6/3_8e31TAXi_C/PF14541_6/4_4e03TAXi_C/PF14541_6/1_7e03TAXi_C/PF14541_6/1_3e19_NODE_865_length_1931_cov_35_249471_g652_i0781802
MRGVVLAGLLGSVTSAVSEYYYHDSSSPAVGQFPGRRLSSAQPDHPEYRRLQTAPLYGSINDYAYYFVDVLVGSPPKRQSVILDSGSSLLGFPCNGCGRHCGKHLDPPFDVAASRTAERYSCRDPRCISREPCRSDHVDTCLYTQVYSEGSSIEGFFFSDQLALGDVQDQNSFVTYDYIGCHTRETVLFTTQQASGILGVSFPKGGRQPTVMDVLMGSEYVNSKVFALCAAEDGGLLSVGGYNSSYHVPSISRVAALRSSRFWPFLRGGGSGGGNSPSAGPAALSKEIVWAPIISDSNYQIPFHRISLLGTDLVTGGFGEVLVDSGTTYSYFPHDVYRTLSRALLDLCKRNNSLQPEERAGECSPGRSDLICFRFENDPETELPKIPSFMVDLGNEGVIEWQANSWLFRKSEKVWCSALEDNRRAQTILGMSFMKNKEVIFDRDNSYIGFVSASCPKHDALNRPQPPDAQKSGLVISDISKEGQKMVSIQRANDTSFSWYNSRSPAAQQQEGEDIRVNLHPVTPLSKTSWVVGGGVSIAVVGGLMATVLKSVRNRSRSSPAAYDPLTDPAPPTA